MAVPVHRAHYEFHPTQVVERGYAASFSENIDGFSAHVCGASVQELSPQQVDIDSKIPKIMHIIDEIRHPLLVTLRVQSVS